MYFSLQGKIQERERERDRNGFTKKMEGLPLYNFSFGSDSVWEKGRSSFRIYYGSEAKVNEKLINEYCMEIDVSE